jgi:putative Holliday junction resolvase
VNNSERLICIDYGAKFIGLAVADFPGITARALETIDVIKKDAVTEIGKAIASERVNRILLGFPFSDVEGEIHRQIRIFREKLLAAFPSLAVDFVDESYSSVEADELLSETGIGRKKKSRAQDSEAAKLVLLRYLRANSGEV